VDADHFDRMARALATASTRRRSLATAALGMAALSGPWTLRDSEAKAGHHKQRKRQHRRKSGDKALYPDLRTLPPTDFAFDELDDGSHVLRLTNTVWNAGEGRLELQAATQPTAGGKNRLYQNLYDAPVGGKRVGRRRVHGRIVYHPSHQHYHFADFASYLLLRRAQAGTYQPVSKGTKTSFCIIDSFDVKATQLRQYTTCEQELQGLTPGWGDIYRSNLPDQWIVIGAGPLADGEYAVQSTADPKGLLSEGGRRRETNNAATTYFSVENGIIVDERASPDRTARATPDHRE
jgi:hypothetical protein